MENVIGKKAERKLHISSESIQVCAALTGDYNPLHMDEEAAQRGPFGRIIAHGVLAEGLISAVLGMDLPGEGTIYLEQKTQFLKPVFVEDEITATVQVTERINASKGIVRLQTTVTNQYGEVVADGYAIVMNPRYSG